MANTWAAVSCSFAGARPRPHLRFARLNFALLLRVRMHPDSPGSYPALVFARPAQCWIGQVDAVFLAVVGILSVAVDLILKNMTGIMALSVCVVHIRAVAQGIVNTEGGSHGAGGGEKLAPCAVSIPYHRGVGEGQDGDHVTLQVSGVVIGRAVVGDRHGCAVGVIGKVQGLVAHGHLAEAAAVVHVGIRGGAVGTLGADTVGIVGEGPRGEIAGHGGQLASVLPRVSPSTVIGGVANGVVNNGLATVILPLLS